MGVRQVPFCDVDASEDGVTTHTLTFDGRTAKLDLCTGCADKLGKAVTPYLEKGTVKADGSGGGKMRKWLQEHGHQVKDRGKISPELQKLYHDANPEEKA